MEAHQPCWVGRPWSRRDQGVWHSSWTISDEINPNRDVFRLSSALGCGMRAGVSPGEPAYRSAAAWEQAEDWRQSWSRVVPWRLSKPIWTKTCLIKLSIWWALRDYDIIFFILYFSFVTTYFKIKFRKSMDVCCRFFYNNVYYRFV